MKDYTTFFVIYGLDYMFSMILSFIFMEYYSNKRVNKLVYIYSYCLLFSNFLLMFTISYEIMFRQFSKTYKKTNFNLVGLQWILTYNYKIIFFFLVSASRYIFPFAKHFFQSGEFTFGRKIWDAFKRGLIEFLLFNILILALFALLENVVIAFFFGFSLITLIYTMFFLGHSMITIPKKLKIHSDINLSIEYYEYKANKKLKELTKHHEKIINTYYQCHKTLEYIKNVQDFLNDKGNTGEDEDNLKQKEKEENDNDEEFEENSININTNDIKEKQNKFSETLIESKNEDEAIKISKEKEKWKIKKDYKKHKSIIKYKQYIDIVLKFVQELIEKYKINIGNERDEKPIKKYNNIVKANFKMKLADREIERISAQILDIYNGWSFKKGIALEINKLNKKENAQTEEEAVEQEQDKEFIAPTNISLKKIKFYQKYNKIIYISLMILVILIDLLIIFQEVSLCLPINLSVFSFMFNKINNPLAIHIIFIIIAGTFYWLTAYSFSKIKSLGKKYIIVGGRRSNSLAILMFCQRLSTISYPISMNIILMIFYKNIGEDEEQDSVVERNYGNRMGSSLYYIFSKFIPLILIIVIIFDYFNIIGRLCKKRKKNQSFYLKNEIREKKILNGRAYLMKLNKDNFGSLENKENIIIEEI